jgi:hypothetical protein
MTEWQRKASKEIRLAIKEEKGWASFTGEYDDERR